MYTLKSAMDSSGMIDDRTSLLGASRRHQSTPMLIGMHDKETYLTYGYILAWSTVNEQVDQKASSQPMTRRSCALYQRLSIQRLRMATVQRREPFARLKIVLHITSPAEKTMSLSVTGHNHCVQWRLQEFSPASSLPTTSLLFVSMTVYL